MRKQHVQRHLNSVNSQCVTVVLGSPETMRLVIDWRGWDSVPPVNSVCWEEASLFFEWNFRDWSALLAVRSRFPSAFVGIFSATLSDPQVAKLGSVMGLGSWSVLEDKLAAQEMLRHRVSQYVFHRRPRKQAAERLVVVGSGGKDLLQHPRGRRAPQRPLSSARVGTGEDPSRFLKIRLRRSQLPAKQRH